MSRIAETFEQMKLAGRKGFIPFVTAGDPDLNTSLSIVQALAANGADIIELGIPFSDPMADGPTIQRSSQRALEGGTRPEDVLALAKEFRRASDVPIVLFSYFNPILQLGIDRFCALAADCAVDGILLTDVIEDEAAVLSKRFGDAGVDLISLVAPTTSDDRLRFITDRARGFIYAVSRAGVTGAQTATSSEAEKLVRRVKAVTALPVAVGFGISTAEQVVDVWRYADAAVVGSAIVAEIEAAGSPGEASERVEKFVRQILPKFAKTSAEN